MKQHEREFFICRIRSGKLNIKINEQYICIIPPTFDIIMESCEIYNESYEKAYGIAYQQLVKSGLRPQIRKKYR